MLCVRLPPFLKTAALELVTLPTALTLNVLSFVALWRWHTSESWARAILGTGLLLVLAAVLRRLRLDRGVKWLIFASAVVYLLYFWFTSINERNYDLNEELRYIDIIAKEHRRPGAADCFVCHHPPLYFTLAAGVSWCFERAHVLRTTTAIQALSFVLAIVLVTFAARTAELLFPRPRHQRLAVALVGFWPSLIVNSVRIHNDCLAGPLAVIGGYYLLSFWQTRRLRPLILAAVFVGLGVLTKSSGYIGVAWLGVLGSVHLWHERRDARAWREIAGAFAIVAVVMGTMVLLQKPKAGASFCHRIAGSACDIGGELLVHNAPRNYLFLDAKSYVRSPFINAYRDESGRQSFWNVVLKSSLFQIQDRFEDPETTHELNGHLARIEELLLLGLVALPLGVGLFAKGPWWRKVWPLFVGVGLALAFLIAFHATIPSIFHSDFRHVYAAAVFWSMLCVASLEWLESHAPRVAKTGTGLCIAFIVLSVVFYLPKYWLVLRYGSVIVDLRLMDHQTLLVEGTAWNAPKAVPFPRHHILRFASLNTDVKSFSTAVDNNDRYEFVFVTPNEERTVVLSPKTPIVGLAPHHFEFERPLKGVREVRIRALQGDNIGSFGYLLFNTPAPASLRKLQTPPTFRGYGRPNLRGGSATGSATPSTRANSSGP